MPDEAHAPTPPGKRNGGFAVLIGAASPGRAKRSPIGRKVADVLRSKALGKVTAHSQDPASNGTPRSHQRRWSADLCRGQNSCVIIVRKNKTEPEPPQRSWSLLTPYAASGSAPKRYSCPPIGVYHSPSQSSSSSSSSSSSTTSSCSSPPPVPTSVITGHDPLGWKLRPKSGSASSRARAKRLSLQTPLPAFCPDPNPSLSSQSHSSPNADPLLQTKPPLRLKPPRRRHSDSSASPRPPATFAAPVVTLEDLCAVRLHPAARPEESDDVFSDGEEGQNRTGPRRAPPPVPNKSFMARQVAQLIAQSRRRRQTTAPTIKAAGDVCASVLTPRQTADYNRAHATKRGLRPDAGRTREQLASRFPDREV